MLQASLDLRACTPHHALRACLLYYSLALKIRDVFSYIFGIMQRKL
jgi:hypothetical protein